jgi:hypothetical protein
MQIDHWCVDVIGVGLATCQVRPNPLEQRFLLKLYLPGGKLRDHWMAAYLDSLKSVMAAQAGSKGLPGEDLLIRLSPVVQIKCETRKCI